MAIFDIITTHVPIEYEGKIYKLSPLSLKQYAEYCLLYKWRELEELLKIKNMLSPQLFEEKRREVYEKCAAKGWTYHDASTGEQQFAEFSFECPEIRRSLTSEWGSEKQLLLSIQILHPEVDSELLSKIIPLNKWGEIVYQFLQINGLVKDKNEEDEDPLVGGENLNQ